MANKYYNRTYSFPDNVTARGTEVKAEFDALTTAGALIESDFNTLNANLIAAIASGSPYFPTINSANAGQSLVVNAAGNAYVADSAQRGYRNKALNPGFEVAQMGTSFRPTSTANMYCLDGWICQRAGFVASLAVTQQNYANYSAQRLQRDSGNSSNAYICTTQSFESKDVKRWAGNPLSLQLKLKAGANFSAAGSSVGVYMHYGTGTDGNVITGFTNLAVLFATSTAVSGTNTPFKFPNISLPANATQLCIYVYYTPVGTAGVDDWLEISDVQLEEGAYCTVFERKKYAQELNDCQRYLQQFENGGLCLGIRLGVNMIDGVLKISKMRSAPSLINPKATPVTWNNAAPGANQVAFYDYAMPGYSAITGALTIVLNGSNVDNATLRFQAGTSFSGSGLGVMTVGTSCPLFLSAQL